MASRVERKPELRAAVSQETHAEWVVQLTRLQDALTLCPTDVLSRCQLATLLEQLDQHEEALFNWNAVLTCDPNNLTAREGVVRCRRQTGRPLQSSL